MTNDELVKSIENSGLGPKNGRCELIVENTTPAGWEVKIIEGGAKFFYRDNTEDIDGPRPVNILGGGGRESFYSKKPSGCVYQIFLVIKVMAKGEPGPIVYTITIDDVNTGECMNIRGVTFGPKATISEADLSPGAWGLRLGLSKS